MASSVSLPTGGLDGVADDWDAQTIGLYLALLIVGNGATARGGVVPSAGNPLKVSPVSGQMKVSVADGRGAVAVPNSLRGVQPIYLGADELLDVQAADNILDRRDIVIGEVGDFGTSALNFREIRVVKGRTDVAGAPKPTTNWVTPPTGGSAGVGRDLGNGSWMELATVFIGHGQTSVTVSDTRQMLTLPGGAPAIFGAADSATNPSAWTSWLPPYSLVPDPNADEIRIYDAVRGMVEVLASGTRLDYGTFRASLNLQAGPPASNSAAETNQGAWDLDESQSYLPTASVDSNVNVINLAPNAVYDVAARLYIPNGLTSVDFAIISATSGNEMLAGVSTGSSTGQHWSLCTTVYSNVHPQITTLIRNNNTIAKNGVLTTLRVSRRQTGRTGV